MSIRRKPEKPADEAKVNAIINKGGTPPKRTTPERTTIQVIMRLKPDILERIDTVAAARPINTPRHTWMMEALLEKLGKEELSKEERLKTGNDEIEGAN